MGHPRERVPNGTIVRFRELACGKDIRTVIITAIAFLLLTGLVAGLIIERQRRSHAELAEAKNRSDVVRAMRLAVAAELSGSIAHEIHNRLARS